MRIPESELIINSDGTVFHLHIRPEQLADNIILVGDPGRVSLMKPFLDSLECEGQSREFVWATGEYSGKRVTILSTGIGCDNIDIVMTELDALANIDFKTRELRAEHRRLSIIRIGTCGAIQPEIPIGAYIFSHIAIGFDGLLNWYEGRDSIALLDFEKAFKKHMDWDKHLPDPYFVRACADMVDKFKDVTYKGMTISAPGFYGPQGRSVRLKLSMHDMLDDIESFEYEGYKITNFEMESSAIFGLAAKLGHDAGSVCCAVAHRHHKDANTNYQPFMEKLVQIVLERLTW